MSEPSRGLRAIVMGLIALCIIASLTGAKGDDKQAGLRVAVVDKVRLGSEYKFAVASDSAIHKQESDALTVLQTWQQNYLLQEADQRTLSDLVLAENTPVGLNPQQKANKQKLLDQSKSLLERFNALQTKQVGALTQADKDDIARLTKAASDTDARLTAHKQAVEKDLQKQVADNATKLLKDVREGVKAVAKEKGYNLVFSNDVVWYAENDITDQVLGHLNKGQ
jgi:Skp family chaperone for outer membrane proteins